MLGFLARKGCKILAIAFLVASVPLDHACAGSFYFNTDFQNNTGSGVNDFEMILHSNSAIHVSGLYMTTSPMSPSVAFPTSGISSNDTTVVGLNWSGATIGNNVWTHIGAFGTAPDTVSVSSASWTQDGFPSGGVPFPSLSANNQNGTNFGVLRGTLYSSPTNGLVIGHIWYEGPADPGSTSFASFFNANSGAPTIYISWAFNTPSPTPIPIEALNESLTGFGPESPIQTLSIPEPSSLLMLMLGLGLGVCGCVLHGKRVVSRLLNGREGGPNPTLILLANSCRGHRAGAWVGWVAQGIAIPGFRRLSRIRQQYQHFYHQGQSNLLSHSILWK